MSNRLKSLACSAALMLVAFSGTLYFGSLAIFNGSSLLGFIAAMCLSGVFSFGVCYAPDLLTLSFAKDQMADVPDAGRPDFFCIEASNAGPDVIALAPGAEHRLGQVLSIIL